MLLDYSFPKSAYLLFQSEYKLLCTKQHVFAIFREQRYCPYIKIL